MKTAIKKIELRNRLTVARHTCCSLMCIWPHAYLTFGVGQQVTWTLMEVLRMPEHAEVIEEAIILLSRPPASMIIFSP